MAPSLANEKFGLIWRRGGNWVGFFLFWMISSAVVSLLEHSEQNKELTVEAEKIQEVERLKMWITGMKDENDSVVTDQIDKLLKFFDNPLLPKLWAKLDFEQAIFNHHLSKLAVELLVDEFSSIKNNQLEKDDRDGRQLAADLVHFFSEDKTVTFFNKTFTTYAKNMEKVESDWEKRCLEKKNTGLTCEEKWSFGDSLHYVSTIFTSTGYGARTPITPEGKFMTILMIMTQLPFFLHCLATTAKNINQLLDKFLGLSENHDEMANLTGDETRNKIAKESNFRFKKMVMVKGLLMITGVLAVHMIIASVYTALTTGWSFGDVLYFQFVNYASIGFGDLIPEDEYTVVGAIFKNLLIKIPAEILLFAMLIRVLPSIS